MSSRKKMSIIIGGIALVGGAALVTVLLLINKHVVPNPIAAPPLVDKATLHSLPTKNASSAYTARIDKTIIPPTNSWISGMVLQKTPLPVFPMPLSFLAKDTGFEIGLPTISSQATVIAGGHTAGIAATLQGATGFMLTRYDKVSADLTYKTSSGVLGVLTLAEGSPYVFYKAQADSTLQLSNIGSKSSDSSSTYLRYSAAGHDYAIATTNGAEIKTNGATATITAPKDSFITFYALPGNGSDNLKEFSANKLIGVSVTNKADGQKMRTSYTYKTENSKPTVFVPMSYSSVSSSSDSLGNYESIYGPMKALKGTSFEFSADTIQPSNTLNVSKLSDAHKQQLIASLPADVAKTSITAKDSYYGGKQLARAANLLDIAEQLGQSQAAEQLKLILNNGFSSHLGKEFFYYDTTLKGVAAQTSAFGSEDFNDHHFHYGYFIYAASILGKYDAEFIKNNKDQINLLVADIASYQSSDDFPLERYYDPYAGHSWAAGLAPFADGNNQESSSEAMNAWNGVALWASLTNNAQLKDSAVWMLSNEAATAKAAWRTVDTSASYLKQFKSPLTSLNFGGKRTYSTFFSDEANAKLGIQLIPMSPMMQSFASDGSSIKSVIGSSIQNDNYNVALGDYVLMYLALTQPQKAATLVTKQQDKFIDDGNSRTYLDAWVFSHTDS